MWELVSSQPIFIVFLGDFHRDHGETELILSVKTSVIDLQRILGSDGRCVQGRKTQEEVHGMEIGKQMAIQRPVYLPKINSEVQQTQEPPLPSLGRLEEQSLSSVTSPKVPNTELYTQWALNKCADN